MKYNEAVVVAAIATVSGVFGISIGAEFFSPAVCKQPPCEGFVFKYQSLIVGVIAFLAASFAAVPVWRQLTAVSIQSAVQSRSVLQDRSEAASDAVLKINGLLDQLRPDVQFSSMAEAQPIAEKLLSIFRVLGGRYLNDESIDRPLRLARLASTRLIEDIKGGRVTVDASWKVATGMIKLNISEDFFRAANSVVHALNVLRHRLRRRVVELDRVILGPEEDMSAVNFDD